MPELTQNIKVHYVSVLVTYFSGVLLVLVTLHHAVTVDNSGLVARRVLVVSHAFSRYTVFKISKRDFSILFYNCVYM